MAGKWQVVKAQTADVMSVLAGVTDVFLSQGVVGATLVVALIVAAWLYRDMHAERIRHATEMEAERQRHAVEIAAERKLNMDIQEQRLSELRAGLTAIEKASTSIEAATTAINNLMLVVNTQQRSHA